MTSDTVADLFSGTFSSGRACMSLPKAEWRYFVGSELIPACYSVSTRLFVRDLVELLKKKTIKASQLTLNVADKILSLPNWSTATSKRLPCLSEPKGYPTHSIPKASEDDKLSSSEARSSLPLFPVSAGRSPQVRERLCLFLSVRVASPPGVC